MIALLIAARARARESVQQFAARDPRARSRFRSCPPARDDRRKENARCLRSILARLDGAIPRSFPG